MNSLTDNCQSIFVCTLGGRHSWTWGGVLPDGVSREQLASRQHGNTLADISPTWLLCFPRCPFMPLPQLLAPLLRLEILGLSKCNLRWARALPLQQAPAAEQGQGQGCRQRVAASAGLAALLVQYVVGCTCCHLLPCPFSAAAACNSQKCCQAMATLYVVSKPNLRSQPHGCCHSHCPGMACVQMYRFLCPCPASGCCPLW